MLELFHSEHGVDLPYDSSYMVNDFFQLLVLRMQLLKP